MPQTCVKAVGTSPNNFGSDFKYLAEPISRGEKIRVVIERAARLTRFHYWRAYEIWYGRAKITIEERDAIAAAAKAKREKETRDEFQELKVRLARLESRLVQTDAEFHRENISGLQQSVRGRG